ncbi:unnamed protein product [Pleuronectes platessa]|uniref:Uncharacterized protein n=1 Tax=Pleuronectes platessa TaxID=8262 RepID=A0A9N7VXN8_PLEPL|nr:unnamed protein product [Pleuronectes platessa]
MPQDLPGVAAPRGVVQKCKKKYHRGSRRGGDEDEGSASIAHTSAHTHLAPFLSGLLRQGVDLRELVNNICPSSGRLTPAGPQPPHLHTPLCCHSEYLTRVPPLRTGLPKLDRPLQEPSRPNSQGPPGDPRHTESILSNCVTEEVPDLSLRLREELRVCWEGVSLRQVAEPVEQAS